MVLLCIGAISFASDRWMAQVYIQLRCIQTDYHTSFTVARHLFETDDITKNIHHRIVTRSCSMGMGIRI
ncbi:unnamed protein product [Adineta ricciae]|uniref:Uncharacterized protein n=1 Tax=Adineta ricciae TaxID=249248 RepID=A0A814CVU4_ADIRI|nr:unnamed protein product [Adineta ricciae]